MPKTFHQAAVRSVGVVIEVCGDKACPDYRTTDAGLVRDTLIDRGLSVASVRRSFNTSIPSKEKSAGKMLVISEVFRVFADQHYNCVAFKKDNLALQAKEAAINPSPPWQKGQKRRK